MAVTNITTGLDRFNPVYNPIVHMFDSTNKSQPGFRYVIDVYETGTANKIFEARVAPRPGDGYGYIDLSKILADYIEGQVDLTSTTSYEVPDSYFVYDLKVGEEYQVAWEFTDTIFATGNRVQLEQVPNTTPHTFSVGDQILISQDDPTFIPNLEGLQAVYSVPDAYNIVVDVNFISTGTNTGSIVYADGRKTVVRDLLTYSAYVAYNAAFSFADWPTYSVNTWQMSGTLAGTKYLSNIPSNYYVTTTQDLFLAYSPGNTGDVSYIYFENSNGDLFRKAAISNNWLSQVAAGPNNAGTLTLITGTAGLIKSDTTYYDVWMEDASGTQVSDSLRINIDTRCRIEDWEILFEDRKGTYASFAFQLRSEQKISIKRETYNKQLGGISDAKWTYDVSDAGFINTNIEASKEYTLRANRMTYNMNVYFEELITSPNTYVKIGNIYYKCLIQENSYGPQSEKNKNLIPKSITIKLSNENIINI